jgi:hypothetical protein
MVGSFFVRFASARSIGIGGVEVTPFHVNGVPPGIPVLTPPANAMTTPKTISRWMMLAQVGTSDIHSADISDSMFLTE